MPIFLSFNDTTDQPLQISQDFVRASEFLKNMLSDCDSVGNSEEHTIIPFPFEISNEKDFSRFYQFWQTNNFQDGDNMIVDLIEFINLSDFLQMNEFKQELFLHLKKKLGKMNMDQLNSLLNPYGTDAQKGKDTYETIKNQVLILKNFYDNEKASMSVNLEIDE